MCWEFDMNELEKIYVSWMWSLLRTPRSLAISIYQQSCGRFGFQVSFFETEATRSVEFSQSRQTYYEVGRKKGHKNINKTNYPRLKKRSEKTSATPLLTNTAFKKSGVGHCFLHWLGRWISLRGHACQPSQLYIVRQPPDPLHRHLLPLSCENRIIQHSKSS